MHRFTEEGGVHFVLWSGGSCAAHAVRGFVLGDDERTRCVVVSSSD